MTGSGINIFTIMFTGMAMINPLKSIAGVHTQFARFSDNGKVDLTQQKFQFVALNLVCLGVALYKVRPRPPPPRPPPRPSSAAAAADPPPGAGAVPRDGAAADDGVGLGDVRDGVEGARPALRPLPRLSRPALVASAALPPSSRASAAPRAAGALQQRLVYLARHDKMVMLHMVTMNGCVFYTFALWAAVIAELTRGRPRRAQPAHYSSGSYT